MPFLGTTSATPQLRSADRLLKASTWSFNTPRQTNCTRAACTHLDEIEVRAVGEVPDRHGVSRSMNLPTKCAAQWFGNRLAGPRAGVRCDPARVDGYG